MSEPSETSGRPLAPVIKEEQRTQGNLISTPPSSKLTRQRKSSQTSDTGSGSTKSTSQRPGATSTASPGPHGGSSRSKQKSTAVLDSMSSHMSPVHYTRTGRVSKAKKGLKVHNCECGRSYTRAEHLRRHQKNHAQEDALICEFPNCGKPFYRLDLLHRHQERHSETGKESRQSSVFSSKGSPVMQTSQNPLPEHTPMLNSTMSLPPTPQAAFYPTVPMSPVQETPVPSSHKQQRSFNRVPNPTTTGILADGVSSSVNWDQPYSQSPSYSSSSGFPSPLPDYTHGFSVHPYGHDTNRTRTSSNASLIEPWYTPRSPISSNSTMPYTWAQDDKPTTVLAYMDPSYPVTSLGISAPISNMPPYGQYGPKTMMQRDDEECGILFPEPYGMGQFEHAYPFDQFLNNYWRLFHPTFPVVHRPTFESMNKPPMLLAAMIAIGGQYSDDTQVKRKSRDLHDRCKKLLEKRDHEPMAEEERTADSQSVFLIEILSQYRARRAAKTLSPRFGTVYLKATENFKQRTSHITELVLSLRRPENATPGRWIRWTELTTWQHLLVSCYIVESHQALLLARQPHCSLFPEPDSELPFPTHTSVWDAKDFEDWSSKARDYSLGPQYVFSLPQDGPPTSCTPFQSALLIAANYNRFGTSLPYDDTSSTIDITHLLDASFTTRHNLLTAKLTQVTPLRALLAVSGESWILSEKVASQQAFSELKTTLRSWVYQLWSGTTATSNFVPVHEALALSVQILQHAMDEKVDWRSLEMGPDMGFYFAALVLWTVTVATTSRARSATQPAQHALSRRHSESPGLAQQLDSFTTSVLAAAQPSRDPSALTRSQPASPIRRDSLTATALLSHEQITANTKTFLNIACQALVLPPQSHAPLDLHSLQAGCTSLLLWVKLHLRGTSLKTETGLAVWAGRPGEGLGELLDSMVGSLERVLNHGWIGWSF